MPKEKVLPADVRVFLRECTLLHPDMGAGELRKNYDSNFRKEKIPNPSVASWRKVGRTVFTQKFGLSIPWSIGVAHQAEMPPEAMPDLLSVWRYCFERVRPFTLRQAKWIVRLKSLEPLPDTPTASVSNFDREAWLLRLSLVYIEFENQHRKQGEAFDTTNIDAGLILSRDEYMNGVYNRRIQPTMISQFRELMSTAGSIAGRTASSRRLQGSR